MAIPSSLLSTIGRFTLHLIVQSTSEPMKTFASPVSYGREPQSLAVSPVRSHPPPLDEGLQQ